MKSPKKSPPGRPGRPGRPKGKLHFIDVSIGEAMPNPLFNEWQLFITRFLTYRRPVKCAHCGKLKRRLWTQLMFFRVMDCSSAFELKPSKTICPPLTPVCPDHILTPEKPVAAKKTKAPRHP